MSFHRTALFMLLMDDRENRLDLVPLVSGPWSLDRENLWRLPGAHGEEVVRSVHLDEQVCFACFLVFYGFRY